MANSSLVDYTKLSPNHSGKRTQKVTKITPHHMGGNLSVETCGNVFAPASRQASSNYGVDSKGRVGLYVDEDKRSWCSSSAWNDQRAVTIEVADEILSPGWKPSDKAYQKLVDLCADIVKRNPGIVRANGKPGLNYTGDKNGSLTEHMMFSATGCPGAWLHANMKKLEQDVNAKLDGTSAPAAKPGETKPAPAAPAKKPEAAKPAAVNPPAEIEYRVHDGSKWLPAMIGTKDTSGGKDTFGGNLGKSMRYIAINMPKGSWYQVKTKNGWLPKVYAYNVNDLKKGCAGDGNPILAVRVYYNTTNPGATGYYKAKYRVHANGGKWFGYMLDTKDASGGKDDFAGNGSSALDALQLFLQKA